MQTEQSGFLDQLFGLTSSGLVAPELIVVIIVVFVLSMIVASVR